MRSPVSELASDRVLEIEIGDAANAVLMIDAAPCRHTLRILRKSRVIMLVAEALGRSQTHRRSSCHGHCGIVSVLPFI